MALLETPVAHPPRWMSEVRVPDDQGLWGRVRGHLHLSGSARPGPPRDHPVPPAAPKPPKWRVLVLVFGMLISFMLLTRGSPTSTKPHSFTYSAFRQEVQADRVATASIDVNGRVKETLKEGGRYTSQIPVALRDDKLAPTLEQHGVQISGRGPRTPFVSVLRRSSWMFTRPPGQPKLAGSLRSTLVLICGMPPSFT